MKKGVIELKTLIIGVISVVIALVLLAVLISLWNVFTAEELTPAERDFNRVVAELEDIIDQPEDISIAVPLEQQGEYIIYLYPSDDPELPAMCGGDSCICLVEWEGAVLNQECKVLPGVKRCSDECSDEPCIIGPQRITAQRSVILNKDCNRLSFT